MAVGVGGWAPAMPTAGDGVAAATDGARDGLAVGDDVGVGWAPVPVGTADDVGVGWTPVPVGMADGVAAAGAPVRLGTGDGDGCLGPWDGRDDAPLGDGVGAGWVEPTGPP